MPAHYLINDRTKQATKPTTTTTTVMTPATRLPPTPPFNESAMAKCTRTVPFPCWSHLALFYTIQLSLPQPLASISCGTVTPMTTPTQQQQPTSSAANSLIIFYSFRFIHSIHLLACLIVVVVCRHCCHTAGAAAGAGACHSVHMPHCALS